jgi:hypothetical protein
MPRRGTRKLCKLIKGGDGNKLLIYMNNYGLTDYLHGINYSVKAYEKKPYFTALDYRRMKCTPRPEDPQTTQEWINKYNAATKDDRYEMAKNCHLDDIFDEVQVNLGG